MVPRQAVQHLLKTHEFVLWLDADAIVCNPKFKVERIIESYPSDDILEILRQYRRDFSPLTKIEVMTNGYGTKVAEILAKIPDDVEVNNTTKSGNVQPHFVPFNIAPKDVMEHQNSDFRNGCWIVEYCGFDLGPSG